MPVPAISATAIPADTLITCYRDAGEYADCYCAIVHGDVSLARFVEAFYTCRLFKVERFILRYAVRKPSTDGEARAIARGDVVQFAAWTLEARDERQLLMCDFMQRTRSWFKVQPEGAATRLHFGTAVVRVKSRLTGEKTLGPVFHSLQWFHKLYARALLKSAIRRLEQMPGI